MPQQFLHYLKNEKRSSPHTIKSYSTDLRDFQNYLSQSYEIDQLTDAGHIQIRSWVVNLMEKGMDPRSVRRKISCLNAYYKFMQINQHIKENPVRKIKLPKTAKRLPVFVEEARMDNLMNEFEFGNDFEGVRDKMIFEMLYASGMRLSELIGLKDSDIQQDRLKVLGKRNKERIIPVSSHLALAAEHYLNSRKNHFPDRTTDHFLVTDNGQKLYPQFVYRKVNFYLSQVTTNKKRSPHVLRHTFATHLLNKGADLNAVKELLGHASLAATQVYTHNTVEKLKSIYQQAHPLAG